MTNRNYAAKLQVIGVTDNNNGSYTVQGIFNDETSTYTPSGTVGGFIFVDNSGTIYEIIANNSGDSTLMNITVTGDQVPVNGAGFVSDPTCLEVPLPPSGSPDDLVNLMLQHRALNVSEVICNLLQTSDISLTGGTITGTDLIMTNTTGGTITIDMSPAFDDSNLSRIVSGAVINGSILQLTRDDASQIDIDISSIVAGSVSFTDNGDGTFTFVDDEGNSTVFNANTPASQSNVNTITGLTGTTVQQILEELAGIQDVHIQSYQITGGTTFVGTLTNGTTITVDLGSAIQAGETVTNLSYSGTVLTYTNETGNTVSIDLGNLTTDIYVTGVTFDAFKNQLTLVDNDDNTPDIIIDLGQMVSEYTDNLDGTYTLTSNNGSITLDFNASNINFDNTSTSITGDNVQDALIEIFNLINGAADENDFLTGASLSGNTLTLEVSNQANVTVDLSDLNTEEQARIISGTYSGGIITLVRDDNSEFDIDISGVVNNSDIIDNNDSTYTATSASGGTVTINTNANSNNITAIAGITGTTVQSALEEINARKGQYTYQVGDAMIKATTKNVTFTKANGEFIVTVPDGHDLNYISIAADSSQIDSNNAAFLKVIYAGASSDFATPNSGQFSAIMPTHIGVYDRSTDFQQTGDTSNASLGTPYFSNQGNVAKAREIVFVGGGEMHMRVKDMNAFNKFSMVVSW